MVDSSLTPRPGYGKVDGTTNQQQQQQAMGSTSRRLWSPLSRRRVADMDGWDRAQELDRIEEQWRRAGIGARHAQQVPNKHQGWSRALNQVTGKLGNAGVLIALIGPRGTGKTQLAAYAIRFMIEGGGTGRYITARALGQSVKDTYGHRDRSEGQAIREMVRPDILVIDELHERLASAWEAGLLVHVVDERYRAAKDTLLIGNELRAAFLRNVGPSIADRMTEGGGVIEMDWQSFRGK